MMKTQQEQLTVQEKTELFDLYDVNRQKLGHTILRGSPVPPNCYRLVVHVCLFSPDGKMLCQRRQPFKRGWANRWDFSVGGSVLAGETSEQGARREAFEELGVTLPANLAPSFTVVFDGGFDDYYCVETDLDIASCKLQAEEVAEVRWMSQADVLSCVYHDEFIPYHQGLIETLFFMRNHRTSHTGRDNSQVVNVAMNLHKHPFEQIVSGRKTIEMRLDDERRQNLQVGDFITFTNISDGQKAVVQIVALHRFADFAALYRSLDLTKCGYSAQQLAAANPNDMLQYYSAEQLQNYGALGIEIKLVAVF